MTKNRGANRTEAAMQQADEGMCWTPSHNCGSVRVGSFFNQGEVLLIWALRFCCCVSAILRAGHNDQRHCIYGCFLPCSASHMYAFLFVVCMFACLKFVCPSSIKATWHFQLAEEVHVALSADAILGRVQRHLLKRGHPERRALFRFQMP